MTDKKQELKLYEIETYDQFLDAMKDKETHIHICSA